MQTETTHNGPQASRLRQLMESHSSATDIPLDGTRPRFPQQTPAEREQETRERGLNQAASELASGYTNQFGMRHNFDTGEPWCREYDTQRPLEDFVEEYRKHRFNFYSAI